MITQKQLAAEMGTTSAGTKSAGAVVPFINRGYNLVHSVRPATLDNLKDWNSQGYVSIISIWFDTGHGDGHSIVVTGYNETGLIVNDPYPPKGFPHLKPQPLGRSSGNNVFISNQLLADLWTHESQYAMMIPYPQFKASKPTSTIGMEHPQKISVSLITSPTWNTVTLLKWSMSWTMIFQQATQLS